MMRGIEKMGKKGVELRKGRKLVSDEMTTGR
jgi:hypothetical protein